MPVNRSAVGALVVAEIVSWLGSRMTYLALPWFVLVTTGSASKMTIVLAVQIAPMAILGIPSGALVQRLGARNTMLVADAARVPLMLALPLLHEADLLSFPVLLALVFVFGCFNPPYFAAQRVILPELVGEDERRMAQANSLIEGGTSFASLVGPALAGVLIPFLGAPSVLYLDAATFAVSFVLVLTMVPARRRGATGESGGLLAGVGFALRHPLIGPVVGTVVLFGLFSSALSAALPVHAFENFGGSARVAGLFFTALGAGALAGTIGAMVLMRRIPPLRLAGLAIVLVTVPLWALPFELPTGAVVGALFASTFFAPLVNGPIIGVITARTPEALRPKVMTAVIALNTAAAPLGFLVAGQVIERLGVAPVFVVVAAGMTAAAVLFASVVLRTPEPPVPGAVGAVAPS